MTGRAELAPYRTVGIGPKRPRGRPRRPPVLGLTMLTYRRSRAVRGWANPPVRNLTCCRRPNPPRTASGWPQ